MPTRLLKTHIRNRDAALIASIVLAVNDGLSDTDARVSSTFGNSITTWNNPGYAPTGTIGVTNNRGGQLRWNGPTIIYRSVQIAATHH